MQQQAKQQVKVRDGGGWGGQRRPTPLASITHACAPFSRTHSMLLRHTWCRGSGEGRAGQQRVHRGGPGRCRGGQGCAGVGWRPGDPNCGVRRMGVIAKRSGMYKLHLVPRACLGAKRTARRRARRPAGPAQLIA